MSQVLAGTMFPASYIVAERWANQPHPGDCGPESWRGQQGKAPMAKDLAFKDQGQLDEPDTWAPGSSQVLVGREEREGLSAAMVAVLGPYRQSQMVYIRPGYTAGSMSYRQHLHTHTRDLPTAPM